MLKNFIKYQSLGNDFIIFDWYKKPMAFMQNELNDPSWTHFVTTTCNRNFGVGADGILIVTNCTQVGMPELLVFNADGSKAETCMNGLRCVAHHLFIAHHFPEQFTIKTGPNIVECTVKPIHAKSPIFQVITRMAPIVYEGQHSVNTTEGSFTGHKVNVGNPHFIILEATNLDWLKHNGKLLESHESFPQRTNVEFVTPLADAHNTTGVEKTYNVLVYERGCGITLACSSGASAITGLLHHLKQIEKNQKIALRMLGGTVQAWVDKDDHIVLQADAHSIFIGSFDNQPEEILGIHHTQAF